MLTTLAFQSIRVCDPFIRVIASCQRSVTTLIRPNFQVSRSIKQSHTFIYLAHRPYCHISSCVFRTFPTNLSFPPFTKSGDLVMQRFLHTEKENDVQEEILEAIDTLTLKAKEGYLDALEDLLIIYESGSIEWGHGNRQLRMNVEERFKRMNDLIPVNPPLIIDFLIDLYKVNALDFQGSQETLLNLSESERLDWFKTQSAVSSKAKREWIRASLKVNQERVNFINDPKTLQDCIEKLSLRAKEDDIIALDELLEVYNSGYLRVGENLYLLDLSSNERLQKMEQLIEVNRKHVLRFLAPIIRYNALDFKGIRETPLNLSGKFRENWLCKTSYINGEKCLLIWSLYVQMANVNFLNELREQKNE